MKLYKITFTGLWSVDDTQEAEVDIAVKVEANNKEEATDKAFDALTGLLMDGSRSFETNETATCPMCDKELTEVEIEDSECYACGSYVARETYKGE